MNSKKYWYPIDETLEHFRTINANLDNVVLVSDYSDLGGYSIECTMDNTFILVRQYIGGVHANGGNNPEFIGKFDTLVEAIRVGRGLFPLVEEE